MFYNDNEGILKFLSQQEDFSKQRAKQHWLKVVDNNTKYLHVYASVRKKKNRINKIKDDNGVWHDWQHGLGMLIGNYYEQLFQSNEVFYDEIFGNIERRTSSLLNQMLTDDFTVEEVKIEIFSMHLDKSLGPYGMNPAFNQRFWGIIQNDVSAACLDVLSSNTVLASLNDTLVVLIPKKKAPKIMGDLRPISLCNVMMKIIAKMLENRMRKVLSEVISKSQSTFIPCRFITDNVIASYDVNHWVKKKTQGKMGYTTSKIDMSKAYDKVEWNFVVDVMIKMDSQSNGSTGLKCVCPL